MGAALTARLLARIPPATIDLVLGGLVIGFALVGLLAFALFIVASLGIGAWRLVEWVGAL